MRLLMMICLVVLTASGCQKLGLYKYGIGDRAENNVKIEENHRKACQQPNGHPVRSDKCGRPLYGVGAVSNK